MNQETTPEIKRRPGRPRKNPEAQQAEPTAQVVKKPRGRRPGSKNKNSAAAKGDKKSVTAVSTGTELQYKPINAWDSPIYDKKTVFKFADGYRNFLNKAKTEREFIKEAHQLAEKNSFRDLDVIIKNGETLKAGDRVYRIVKEKLMLVSVIGKKGLEEGTRIVGAHVDSPRIDIKQNPLYESTDMVFLKTHYYGGIKKYQWVAIPLALHGVIIKGDGTTVEINIGEEDNDPVFTITDLLPHLAREQYDKKLSDAFSGEAMNVLIGSQPLAEKDAKDRFKNNILQLLNEKYGIVEEDLISSELELVPAFKARDIGFDKSMIGAYGHDDRVCAYPALIAALDLEAPEYTALTVLTDKEEIGSVGNTGAESRALENFLADLCALTSKAPYTDRMLRLCLDRSKMLSADVNAAVDPNYEGTHDKMNAGYLGKGLAIMKFSGSRGKSGASDAHAEFLGEIRRLLNANKIPWHITELGAVDKGGGGTIAMMIANLGVDVIDVGVPVLSMHAPFEIVSKIDVYAAYKGYVAFFR